MTLSQHVFLYCERGTSEALSAEPFNAASNAAFLLAALAALWLLLRRPKEARSADQMLLIALVFLIGLGSLAFHLLADRAAMLADMVPIDVFMLVYLGFALNRLLGMPPGWTVLTLIGFAAIVALTTELKCWGGGIGFPAADATGASECLNGSLVYLPALGAMAVVGGLLCERRHPAGSYILWAALLFALSVTFRSLDLALCDAYTIEGRKIGTHFVWHLLNGLSLFLLLRASLEVGAACASRPAVARPRGVPPPEGTANSE
ncbi:MAG: ceramidase domain-containing protein [Methyloceanibacter sp.]